MSKIDKKDSKKEARTKGLKNKKKEVGFTKKVGNNVKGIKSGFVNEIRLLFDYLKDEEKDAYELEQIERIKNVMLFILLALIIIVAAAFTVSQIIKK